MESKAFIGYQPKEGKGYVTTLTLGEHPDMALQEILREMRYKRELYTGYVPGHILVRDFMEDIMRFERKFSTGVDDVSQAVKDMDADKCSMYIVYDENDETTIRFSYLSRTSFQYETITMPCGILVDTHKVEDFPHDDRLTVPQWMSCEYD